MSPRIKLTVGEYEIEGVRTFETVRDFDSTQVLATATIERDTWENWPIRPGLKVESFEGYEELVSTGVWNIAWINYNGTFARMGLELLGVADADRA